MTFYICCILHQASSCNQETGKRNFEIHIRTLVQVWLFKLVQFQRFPGCKGSMSTRVKTQLITDPEPIPTLVKY